MPWPERLRGEGCPFLNFLRKNVGKVNENQTPQSNGWNQDGKIHLSISAHGSYMSDGLWIRKS